MRKMDWILLARAMVNKYFLTLGFDRAFVVCLPIPLNS